jgi:hypothetical protein
MQNIKEYLTSADLQIYINRDNYIYLNLSPDSIISYFKKTYLAPDIFIKDEISLKNIGMRWNETTIVKIPKDIHLMGKVWLSVKIPYFQMIEKITNTTQTITNNANVNEMIFDSHNTYLIIYEDNYYLIPDLFLKLPDLAYNEFKFKFSEIKQYFIDLASINIRDDTDIIFYSFNMNGFYVHDIIPTLLNLVDNYDKLTLNKLLNGNDYYKQNLLTQNSFDNYITKIIEDDLINQYQNINKFDTTIDSSFYNFMALEFDVYYNNRIDTTSDIYKTEEYFNNINTTDSLDTIKQNSIIKSSLVYEYLITNLNPSFEQKYTFYKKYAVIQTDSIYEITLNDENLISGTINSNYPTYNVDIASLNLPFVLTQTMTIQTEDGLSVTYSISGINNIFSINDTSTTTILNKIKLVINTNNNTLNDPNINIQYPDVNANSEWTDNLLINLDKLDYNKQLEVLLFYEFKKNYYSKENVIGNELLVFNSSINSIKNFWIQLKVIQDRFDERDELIGFNNDDYLNAITTLTNNYEYIVDIEIFPQDIFNVYSIVINKLLNTLKKKYFNEFTFLKLFYNKINSYIYQRNKDISTKPIITDFKGLLFYFNIDLTYYINKDIIKNYLLELFHMESYIAYIPTTGTSLTLAKNDINEYMDSTYTDIDTSDYFHELKYDNRYQLLESYYTLLNVGNKIAIKKEYTNYLYYKTNLVEFQLEISSVNGLKNAFLNVTNYSIDDTYLYLTYDTSVYNNTDILNYLSFFYLNEIIKLSVPIIYESSPSVEPYTTAIVTVYDKTTLFNAFISYNEVNVNIVEGSIIIMKYTKNSIETTFKCTIDETILVNPDLPTNYNDYDLIQMISILLPTTNITIDDSDCYNKIATTFPTIELLLSSTVYTDNSALLVGENTFKITINNIEYPVSIISISAPIITHMGTIPAIMYLRVYNNDSQSITSANITIFENTKLPNLYNYSSLDNTVCETNDYFIQKPMLLPFVDLSVDTNIEPNTNIFILTNVPKMKLNGNDDTLLVYLDNYPVLNVYNLYSNQLLRNGSNLYSAYYDTNLLTNNNNISDIESIVTHVYTGLYEDIYGGVVSVIENAQNEYINSYTEIFEYISSGSKFGITMQNIASHAELLNDYKLTSNISTIKQSLYDAKLVDFDSNTLLAMGLYNFTNRSGNIIKTDYDIISALAYKYNTLTMKIVNSPYHYYVPYVKINPIVIKYLDRYSSYATNMNNNLIANNDALILVNNKNFPQEFNEEYQMRDKYYHLATDTNKFIIKSSTINMDDLDPTNKTVYISSMNIDNKEVKYDGTSIYSTEDLEPYKFKPYYKETKYDNMNVYYKLVGAVSILNGAINNELTLPDYLLTDNNTVVGTYNYANNKTFAENFYGINYNSRALDVDTTSISIDSSLITQLPFSFYLYNLQFTADLSSTFTANIKYLVSIEEQTGYLIRNSSNVITLLIGKNILFNLGVTINYLDADAISDNTIFNNILNNTPIAFTDNYVFTEFTLNYISNYNKYFTIYLYNFEFTANLSAIFTADNKYLVSIEEQTGLLIRNSSNVITLLIGKKILFDLGVIINYLDAEEHIYTPPEPGATPIVVPAIPDNTIFNYILNNTPVESTIEPIKNYVFTEFTINYISNYNEYITTELSTPNCIIFNSNDELLLQTYGYTLYSILGIYFINLETTTLLKFYEVLDDTIPLPALNITKSSISYLSTYEELIKNIDNKDYWIALKNLGYTYEFQLKDINTQIFIDGSYVVYFCNNINRPMIYAHPDTFRYGVPLFNGTFDYNPFTNKLTMLIYKNPEYPPNRYINTFTYTNNGESITVNALTEYVVPQNPDNPLGSQDSYLYPQRTYFKTTIRYNTGSDSYSRPIMITNEAPTYDYQYIYTNDNVGVARYIGDALIYLTKIEYQGFTTNTIVTNIKSNINPDNWITDSLTSKSNFIEVVKTTDGGGDKIFQFSIVPNQLIPFDTFNLIEFITENNQKIYLWLYIDNTSNYNPFQLYDNSNSIPLVEPIYYVSYSSNQYNLVPTDVTPSATFEYTDLIYFYNNTTFIEISDYSFNVSVKSIDDTFSNYYEIQTQVFDGSAYDSNNPNYNISIINEWSYIKNVIINEQFIDDLTLQNFNLFIFKSSDDKYYFNIKKNNTNTGIELENSLTIIEGDVYIYSYDPIFMNIPITYNINGETVYIYVNRYNMQRNEVIRIGFYYVQIIKWSAYYNCYLANILFLSDYVPISRGYYSLGVFTNYLIRNLFLKGINYNEQEYTFNSSVENSRLEPGDYYFENNILKQYGNDSLKPPFPEYIFKLPFGNNLPIKKINFLETPLNFYNGTLFDIKPGYTVVFTDEFLGPVTTTGDRIIGYGRYPVMIESVNNNTFTYNPVYAINPFTDQIFYVPYQPFNIQTIIITNNIINITFTGWIQVSRATDTSIDAPFRVYTTGTYIGSYWIPYQTPIIKVVNGVVISSNYTYNGTYLAKIIDRDIIYRNIKHDFNNPLVNVYNNTNISNKIYLQSYTDEEYVYFSTPINNPDTNFNNAIDNNLLQFCYYQSIIVDGVWYNVIKISITNTEDDPIIPPKIYIDVLSSDNKFTEKMCEIIISAANVNNINLISNNHKLRMSHAIDYPVVNYTYDKPRELTSLFKGSNNTKYIYNFNDAEIGPCSSQYYDIPKSLTCPTLLNTVNYFNNNNYNLERFDYYENYIPLWLDLWQVWFENIYDNLRYNFYQIPMDAVRTQSTIRLLVNVPYPNPIYNLLAILVSDYPVYAQRDNYPMPRLALVDNILLQEVTTDGTIYQHFITISINNYYHIKLTSNNTFQNIETSFFYLNNTMPCIITKNNNIISRPPDYHIYREINQIDRKIINITYTVKIIQIDTPSYINNKWRYYCVYYNRNNTDAIKYTKMQLYINNKVATFEYIDDTELYLFIDDFEEVITEFNYYSSASIDSITPDITTIKSNYSSLTKSELDIITGINSDYNFRNSNILYLKKVNNNNLLYFQDQTTPSPLNVNFGDIDDTNYIGKTNTIIYSSINTNNEYVVDTLYSVLDTTSNAILYNIITNKSISTPLYYVLEPEISLSVPALELLINDEGISIVSLLNETKPWKDWTLITTRYNTDLEPYLNNYDLVYDGTTFTPIVSTSYFTNDEITNMESFMTLMYNNTDAQDILTELYLVEQYILEQIINYTSQRYFWNDIVNILIKVVSNYKATFDGTYDWTITNNVLCIVDEFTNYPEHFELVDINSINYYIRKNYLSIDYTINYIYDTTKIKISRDPTIIDSSFSNIFNNTNSYNLYGTNINNTINTLLNYSTRINKIKSPLPIYYKYMDSIKYYIAKSFFEIFNTNNYKFNNLILFNRETNFDNTLTKSSYYGKYYDYNFNKRYFGVGGLNQYYELNNEIDTIYVFSNIINKLYSSYVDENTINKLITNNIFKYNINIKNKGYELTDLIKATNTYTIDIKDNYNHLVDPTIDNVYINTNSLEFSTTEMVQPTDVSIISSEPYNIITKTDYGIVLTILSGVSISSNNIITANNIPILFLKQINNSNFNIGYKTTIYKEEVLLYSNGIDNSVVFFRTNPLRYNYIVLNNTLYFIRYNATLAQIQGYEIYDVDEYLIEEYVGPLLIGTNYDVFVLPTNAKSVDKVVIKTVNISVGNTIITFSSNYNAAFNYITINNIIYEINYTEEIGFYISGIVTIKKGELYEVFRTFQFLPLSTNYYYVSDLTLDRDINPIKYNQTDLLLPMVFNLDNTTINQVDILTTNKIRIIYSITNSNDNIGTTLYHKYRLNESIPYTISIATPESTYYYSVPNTYKITIDDIISFQLYIKTTTITTSTETISDVIDYETIIPPVTNTISYSVTTNEITIIPPTDGTTTTSSSTSNITKEWINQGCHWDGGYSQDPYPIPFPYPPGTGGELYLRTINSYLTKQNVSSLNQAIDIANVANSNVLGLQAGGELFQNNTLTTDWPYRYDKYDATIGVPATCNALGDGWVNHVYTLKKTTNTINTTTTTTISHTTLDTTIYSVDTNNIIFNTNEYVITDLLNTVDMIITKDYILDIVSYVGTKMIANIPENIVNANSIYKIVDNLLNIYDATVIFENYLIITTDAGIPTTNIKLRQIITDTTNHIITENENNQEYTITTTNNTLYYNKSPYFIPIIQCLDTNLNEFDAKYFYKFEYTGTFTFGEFIFIEYNDVYVKAIIIIVQDTIAIVGTNTYINPSLLTIYSADLNEFQTVNILNQYYPYIKGTILEQVNNTTYKILLPMNSLFTFDSQENTTTNKVIITFKYSEIDLNNITYPLVGFNKVPDTITKLTTNTINNIDIEWVENVGIKLFKSIELLIDDTIVEKINPNIYKIISNYFRTIFDRERLLELITLKKNPDNSLFFNLPIPFYFSLIENYLPISSMGRSTIKIKFVLEKLENLISNKVSTNYTLNVIPNIDFNYSFLTVDNKILDKFKKTELLITNFYYYQNFLLNKTEEYNHISLLSRTIELFFITNTKNDELIYTSSVVKDNWYNEYLSNNPNDAYIFNIIDAEIKGNYKRYQVLKNNLILKNYNTRFAMYLDEKYLTYIDEDLNDPSLKFSNKITILILYFKNIYKNTIVYTYQQIIDKLNIYINGKELLPELPSEYHNRVIPYNKGYELPDGYHVYSFNYNSLSSQPNGFINMKKVRDFLIYSSQVDINQYKEAKLKVCTREYKILKIDNLMGKII